MSKLLQSAFVCEEYGEVEVPISSLMKGDELEIYPELVGSGYFDIDYRKDKLRLIAKGFVGIVPINDRVTINVLPRFPISNVFHLVQRSEGAFQEIPGFFRLYGQKTGSTERIEELFGRLLLDTAKLITREGLPRRYISYKATGGYRGRLLLNETVSRHFCKGQRHIQAREMYLLTADSPENRAIKNQISSLERYFEAPRKSAKDLAAVARLLHLRMANVSKTSATLQAQSHALEMAIRSNRAHSVEYLSILWLAYLLSTRKGISLASFGNVSTSSLLVNMANVFESYIRETVRRQLPKVRPIEKIVDGNVTPQPLFRFFTTFNG